MVQPQTRRLPRLVPLAPARPDLPDLWRRHHAWLLPRLASAIGILLLLFGPLWAVSEYGHYKSMLRQAETGRYLAEFHAPPTGAAWQRLNAAWQSAQDRQRTLLATLAASSGSDAALRNYQQFVLETVDEQRLAPDIESVRRYFERLAVCIRVGNCDREVAAAHLRSALRQFRDQHYYYFQYEGTAAEFDRVAAQVTPDEPWLQEAPAAR